MTLGREEKTALAMNFQDQHFFHEVILMGIHC